MSATAIYLFVLLGTSFNFIHGASIPQGRVVDGQEARVNQFPWQVSLRRNLGQHFCGGSLISRTKVLTAAHCVDSYVNSPQSVSVITGAISLARGGEFHSVSHIVHHERYIEGEEYSWRYDVAIITLATPAESSDTQSPIAIGRTTIPGGTPAVTSGWGLFIYSPSSNALPTALQWFNLNIVSNSQCQESFPTINIYQDHICAMSRIGQGVCSGDSGGPLVVNREVVGITSWVSPCANGFPDVYTRVSSHADWITQHLKDA